MAKIALIPQHFDGQSLALKKALEDQRNHVILVSSKGSTELNDQSGLILSPFEKWSSMEAFKFLKYLISYNPDVLHFIFTESYATLTPAHWILAQFFGALPNKVVAASFFVSPKEVNSFLLRLFLKGCDLTTWDSRDHLMFARRQLGLSKAGPLSEIVPPFLDPISQNKSEDLDPSIEKLLSKIGDFIIIPGEPDSFFSRLNKDELKTEKKYSWVFLGERSIKSRNDLDFYVLNGAHGTTLKAACKKSKAILLAFNKLSTSELHRFFELSHETHTPLIVNPSQVEDFPGLVRPQKTGWILENGVQSFRDLIRNNPQLKTQHSKFEPVEWNLRDITGNTIQRLYQKALS